MRPCHQGGAPASEPRLSRGPVAWRQMVRNRHGRKAFALGDCCFRVCRTRHHQEAAIVPTAKSALALLTLSLLSFATTALAASVDPRQFQELKWRSVGPFRGGRVLAVDGDPVDAKRFYFGAVNGGVWRTDDAGRTW